MGVLDDIQNLLAQDLAVVLWSVLLSHVIADVEADAVQPGDKNRGIIQFSNVFQSQYVDLLHSVLSEKVISQIMPGVVVYFIIGKSIQFREGIRVAVLGTDHKTGNVRNVHVFHAFVSLLG